MENVKIYYHRHLPHYQPEYATFHVVYRLAGSIPRQIAEELRQEKDQLKRNANMLKEKYPQQTQAARFRNAYFKRFEALLDHTTNGPTWLKEPDIAMIVKEAIHYRDNKLYSLLAYCIMPNHVHMLFEPLLSNDGQLLRLQSNSCSVETEQTESTTEKKERDSVSSYVVTKILESLKKYTALRANRILQRTGAFWQHESYEHVIRDGDELERTIWYILNNPVKAGLVSELEQWKWSYCKPELIT